ncbi:adenosylcobinamide-phosphate synthase CbiB [Methyloprofundus sp.]|uniref:adenosylcobinamide-phosphate synthase CbiB n=1 Tax=Methyloprofundus sp. TaxID=2020875 RepID=UPI003D116AB6
MTVALAVFIALILDALLGEPKKAHPLVIFGRWASTLEKWLILPRDRANRHQKINGLLALILSVLPICLCIFYLTRLPVFNDLLSPVILYLCIAPKSLLQHTLAIYQPLQKGNLAQARQAIAMIVSREAGQMDTQAIRKATIESTLENGADAIFAPIFWFVIAGPTGAVFYRLSNTLDAMWGYKNQRYTHFGFAAARLDDILNWVPARLTALSYLLLGDMHHAWSSYRLQSPLCESPNAGIVMSTGAGCLNVNLGGAAIYHGQHKIKPTLGTERRATNQDIQRANLLIILTTLLWLTVIALGESLA